MSHRFFGSLIVALSRMENGMKKLIIMLLAVTATLPGEAAAQGHVEMIASDGCAFDSTGNLACTVYLSATDGSKSAAFEDGIEPAWSPDGSRIAFVRYSQPGLFVLNLGDWSLVSVRNRGTSPAWSPDGGKLAFSDGELFVMNADGSSVVQLTNNVGFRGQPAWSPDGSTIAFDCEVESGNTDICASNADGMGFRRLTFDPGWDSGAAFSPDGFAIAFATTRYGLDSQSNSQIAIMYFNGTGVSPVGAFGSQPAWSPDGNRIAFVVVSYVEGGGYFCNGCGAPCPIPPTYTTYIMKRDGTEQREFTTNGTHPKWALEVRPVALFVSPYGCDGLNCAFDGSRSWGGDGAMSYTWNFGDGRDPQVGRTVTHAYAAIGTYRVTLTVKDGAGVIGTQSQDFVVNISPTARFTYACSAWRCTFDGSGSSDPDGSITSYYWAFGDGVSAEGSTVTHIYNAAAAFTVTFRVYDNRGAWGRQQQVVDLSNLVNAPPVARFKATCTALMCTFDGSSSSDP